MGMNRPGNDVDFSSPARGFPKKRSVQRRNSQKSILARFPLFFVILEVVAPIRISSDRFKRESGTVPRCIPIGVSSYVAVRDVTYCIFVTCHFYS